MTSSMIVTALLSASQNTANHSDRVFPCYFIVLFYLLENGATPEWCSVQWLYSPPAEGTYTEGVVTVFPVLALYSIESVIVEDEKEEQNSRVSGNSPLSVWQSKIVHITGTGRHVH